jgi:hypothetical protein
VTTLNLAFHAQLVVPEQRQLYDYWRARAAGRPAPARADITPAGFARLLPDVSLIDVEEPRGGASRYRVRLAGTRLRDAYGREITGACAESLGLGIEPRYWRTVYDRIAETCRPAQGIATPRTPGRDHLCQFWLRLPLSADGRRVDMILCHDAFVLADRAEVLAASHAAIPAPSG